MAVYTAQIVHDPSTGRDVPLSSVGCDQGGASIFGGWTPPPQCGVIATGTVMVTVSGEAVELPVAQAHAQGFIETRSGGATLVELPVILKVLRDGRATPSHLTLDMVAGSELDPRLVSEAAIQAGGRRASSVGKAQLTQFLLTRGHANLSSNTWEQLARKAHNQLALEADLQAKAEAAGEDPPPLALRDHSGNCCRGYLLERGLIDLSSFPQGDGSITAPASTDTGWVSDMNLIGNMAPGISEAVIQEYFSPLGAKQDASVRVLERGYSHIEGLTALDYYGFHPNPIPSRPEIVATRMIIQASFKAVKYATTVWYEIDTASDLTIKPVKRILKVLCAPAKKGGDYCRASGASHKYTYGFCTHGSANIQVLRNLPRADNVEIRSDLVSRTSKLQRWSNPGEGSCYNVATPIWQVSFTAPDRERVTGHRRLVACLSTTTRATLNPVHPQLRHLLSRSTTARTAARRKLHEVMRADFALERGNARSYSLGEGRLSRHRQPGMAELNHGYDESDDSDWEASPTALSSPCCCRTCSDQSDVSLDDDA